MVLQLSKMLRGLGRGSVVKCLIKDRASEVDDALDNARGQAPFQKFEAALMACGP